MELCGGKYSNKSEPLSALTAIICDRPTIHKHCWEKKNLEEGKFLPRKFCDFAGKIKKYIREIGRLGRKFCPGCREINIFPGLAHKDSMAVNKLNLSRQVE